ncbi:hypothetical protein ZEAMMB73_Zm00001d047285 [Zea mays]|uniref:Uncharacterized protein n=1 Tax=Zea mays TaxID=4577 RepID=A0A1D6P8D9_MAIZE|nr:hypothetical protein ZEAMMB73_Zm00001d047285 [Zea mays]
MGDREDDRSPLAQPKPKHWRSVRSSPDRGMGIMSFVPEEAGRALSSCFVQGTELTPDVSHRKELFKKFIRLCFGFRHEARDADRWDSEADDLAPHHPQHARVRTELEDQLLYTYRCHFLDGEFSDFKALPRASGELSDFQELLHYLYELTLSDHKWDDANYLEPRRPKQNSPGRYGGEKPQREATKAIDRKNQSSMLKCLHSAPPKRPRAQFARLSAETEAAGKAPAEPKPRVERICAMRASPIHTKTARKKQSAQIDVTAQQLGEPRPAFNNGIQRKAVEPERVSRAASSTRTTKPARGLPAPPPSRTGKERNVAVKLSRFQTAAA